MAQPARHCRQDITHIIFRRQIVKRYEPTIGTPNRCFIHPDRHDVESTALGGDVGGDTLAKHVFFQSHPFDGVTCLGGEVVCQTLHTDHVTVVYGRDDKVFSVNGARRQQRHGSGRTQCVSEFHSVPPSNEVL